MRRLRGNGTGMIWSGAGSGGGGESPATCWRGDVVAHINGAPDNARATAIKFADAKAIRERLGMSQAIICRAYGIPLKTLQHWEQRRHHPDRTASAYLWTIEEFPDQVREVQQRHQVRKPAGIEERPGR
jgi:putative transcriptional regulator